MKVKPVLLLAMILAVLCLFISSQSMAVEHSDSEEECARTPGYWKNHPQNWPTDGLYVGDTYYGQDQLLDMLKQPVKGEMTVILIKHLIAAKLNVESNPSLNYFLVEGEMVEDIILEADYYLAYEPEQRMELERLKDLLDTFNNSEACDAPLPDDSGDTDDDSGGYGGD